MSLAPFRYFERLPSDEIAPWILSLWSFHSDVSPPPEDPYVVWPDGCTSVALFRHGRQPDLTLSVGPRHTSMQPPVVPGGRLWGFRLWPDVTEPVTGCAAAALRDLVGPAPTAIVDRFFPLLTALPRSDDPDLVFPALDTALATRLRGTAPPEPRVRAAVRTIVAGRGELAMGRVAREAGVGLRHLQRLFPAATGLTLREFSRVRRLREALARSLGAPAAGWSRIAAETGFVDHAHLAHEFIALTGLAPTAVARQLAQTDHDAVVP